MQKIRRSPKKSGSWVGELGLKRREFRFETNLFNSKMNMPRYGKYVFGVKRNPFKFGTKWFG